MFHFLSTLWSHDGSRPDPARNRTILRVDGLEERVVPAKVATPVALVATAPAVAAPTGVKAQLMYDGFNALVYVRWQSVPGATEYRVEVSRDGQPWKSVPAFYTAPKATNFIFWPGATGTYSFRVWAVGGEAVSTPSETAATKVTILPLPAKGATLALPDTATTTVGTSVLVPVTANDRGAVGKITLYSVQNAKNGTTTIENGQVRFTPAPGFVGVATFSYTITDGSLNRRASGNATVLVGPAVANQPVVSVRALTASIGEPGTVGVPTTGTFRFTRTGDLSKPLTVTVEWGGFAKFYSDYKPTPTTVTFAAGKATVDVVVTPVADVWREGDEAVTSQVQFGNGYSVDTTRSVDVITIRDNYNPKLTDPTL